MFLSFGKQKCFSPRTSQYEGLNLIVDFLFKSFEFSSPLKGESDLHLGHVKVKVFLTLGWRSFSFVRGSIHPEVEGLLREVLT